MQAQRVIYGLQTLNKLSARSFCFLNWPWNSIALDFRHDKATGKKCKAAECRETLKVNILKYWDKIDGWLYAESPCYPTLLRLIFW